MHTRHRLCQFRKSKHVLHQRFRSRIFTVTPWRRPS